MPSDALTTALEDLRDTYSQRQRATNSLLAALRGVTGSLSKAGRTLSEYAGQSPGLERAKLSQAQEAFDALRLKDDAIDPLLPDLRREVKAITGVLAALREALTVLEQAVATYQAAGDREGAWRATPTPTSCAGSSAGLAGRPRHRRIATGQARSLRVARKYYWRWAERPIAW